MTTALDLSTLTLAKGGHDAKSGEMCLLEAASFLAGEPWSDHPDCVSKVLGTFGRSLNDVLPDDSRQRLVPLLPLLLNTAGDGLDERRSYLALDWLVRVYLPTWLRLVPALTAKADLIAAAHEVTDLDSAAAIGALVREAASEVRAARAAAGAAAGAAARAAAGAAARDALAPTVSALQDSAISLYERMSRPVDNPA